MLRIAFLVLVTLWPGLALAESHEINTMREILPKIGEDTLVVFDIDNTLLTPAQALGSDEWFYHLVESRKKSGASQLRAEDEAMTIWNQVQADTVVLAVESDTPALITELQKRGRPTLGLTARTHDIADVTLRQLASVQIRLRLPGPNRPDVLVLDEKSHAELHGSVLFVGENGDKGTLLVKLLDRLALRPKHVVFVDDKAKHVANVDRALGAAKIRVDAFRYGAADAKVKAFDPAVADLQLSWWRKILTDQAAATMLRCQAQ